MNLQFNWILSHNKDPSHVLKEDPSHLPPKMKINKFNTIILLIFNEICQGMFDNYIILTTLLFYNVCKDKIRTMT